MVTIASIAYNTYCFFLIEFKWRNCRDIGTAVYIYTVHNMRVQTISWLKRNKEYYYYYNHLYHLYVHLELNIYRGTGLGSYDLDPPPTPLSLSVRMLYRRHKERLRIEKE